MKNTLALALSLAAFALPASFASAAETKGIEVDVMDEYNARPELEGLEAVEGWESAGGELEVPDGTLETQRRDWRRPWRGRVTCFAQNRRGVIFRASGFRHDRRSLQWEAMRRCRNNSFLPGSCRPLGCRR